DLGLRRDAARPAAAGQRDGDAAVRRPTPRGPGERGRPPHPRAPRTEPLRAGERGAATVRESFHKRTKRAIYLRKRARFALTYRKWRRYTPPRRCPSRNVMLGPVSASVGASSPP